MWFHLVLVHVEAPGSSGTAGVEAFHAVTCWFQQQSIKALTRETQMRCWLVNATGGEDDERNQVLTDLREDALDPADGTFVLKLYLKVNFGSFIFF